MSDARPIRLAPILLEAFFVVLGVFLALAANEWRSDVNARERAALARTGIINEIRTNRASVQEMHAYHRQLLDTLRSLPPGSPPPSPRVFYRGFASAASTLSTAWDAANATDAVSYMDFDDVLAFSELYTQQERYTRMSEEVGAVIFGALLDRGSRGIVADYRNLADINGSLFYLENHMLQAYDSVLVRIERTD